MTTAAIHRWLTRDYRGAIADWWETAAMITENTPLSLADFKGLTDAQANQYIAALNAIRGRNGSFAE